MINWEAVAGNLQQQIGELASRYEGNIALMRGEFTKQLQEKDAIIDRLNKELSNEEAEEPAEETEVQKTTRGTKAD